MNSNRTSIRRFYAARGLRLKDRHFSLKKQLSRITSV